MKISLTHKRLLYRVVRLFASQVVIALLFCGLTRATSGKVPALSIPVNIPLDLTVTGKVTDESGEGLPGVSVVVKGTQRGTTTTQEGTYSVVSP